MSTLQEQVNRINNDKWAKQQHEKDNLEKIRAYNRLHEIDPNGVLFTEETPKGTDLAPWEGQETILEPTQQRTVDGYSHWDVIGNYLTNGSKKSKGKKDPLWGLD